MWGMCFSHLRRYHWSRSIPPDHVLWTSKVQEFLSNSTSQMSTLNCYKQICFPDSCASEDTAAGKGLRWVAWVVKEYHLGSSVLRRRPGKKLSQPIYGSDAKVCSKTQLNKLCNLFLLLICSCSPGVMILFFFWGLLFSIFENSFFNIFLHLKCNKYEERSPWCSLLFWVSFCWKKADLTNHLVNLPG